LKQIVSDRVECSLSLRCFDDSGFRCLGSRREATQFSCAPLDLLAALFELSLRLDKRVLLFDEACLAFGKLLRVLTSLLCKGEQPLALVV